MISYVSYIAGRLFTHWATWEWISIKLLKCKLVCFKKAEAHASLYSEYERRSGRPWFCLWLHSYLTRLDSVENSEKIPFLFFAWPCSVATVMSDPLWPHGLKPAWLLCPWDFPGKNTEVGCHFLLQGIFQTQGLSSSLLHLLHCR